jgi:hypothetical protein
LIVAILLLHSYHHGFAATINSLRPDCGEIMTLGGMDFASGMGVSIGISALSLGICYESFKDQSRILQRLSSINFI